MKDNYNDLDTNKEQNISQSTEEKRKSRLVVYFGGAVLALLLLAMIIWQVGGKTLDESGKDLESKKKTENAGKGTKEEKDNTATGEAIDVVIKNQLDQSMHIVSDAAIAAVEAREQRLAEQAAAVVAEEEARKKAEEEAQAKAQAEAQAKAQAKAQAEAQAKKAQTETPAADNSQSSQNNQSSQSSSTIQEQKPAPTQPSAPEDTKGYVDEVIRLVNVERANAGLSPLSKNGGACQGAAVRANEIVNTFSHTRPDGRSCFTVFEEVGVTYTSCGENIAAGQKSPEAVVTAWMNSPGHRANILDEGFEEIGVGVVEVNGYFYWVQLFLRVNW